MARTEQVCDVCEGTGLTHDGDTICSACDGSGWYIPPEDDVPIEFPCQNPNCTSTVSKPNDMCEWCAEQEFQSMVLMSGLTSRTSSKTPNLSNVPKRDTTCKVCDGKGFVMGVTCDACEGTGQSSR